MHTKWLNSFCLFEKNEEQKLTKKQIQKEKNLKLNINVKRASKKIKCILLLNLFVLLFEIIPSSSYHRQLRNTSKNIFNYYPVKSFNERW